MVTARTIDDTPVPPTKLAHYVLRCRRFSETVKWYRQVLVAEAAFANDFVAFLSFDDEHHRIALVNLGPEAPEPAPGAGLDHVGFTVSGLPALMNHYHRLKADDILPAWCVHHGGTLSMYYDDPEGMRCEFQVELFDDPAVFSALMEGPAFAANPIGIEYDPEKLYQRYMAGEDEAALLDQSLLE